MQINNTNGGANVTGTTQNVVVSQWIDLTAVVLNAAGSTPVFSWSQPPGNTAINWNDSADTSAVAMVPIKQSELSSSNLYFAFTDTTGSGQPITVTATLPDGTQLTTQVTYNITVPPVTVSVQEQSAIVIPPSVTPSCPDIPGWSLCLFLPQTGTAGIAFSAVSGCNSPSVNCEWEQVINNGSYVTVPASGQACSISVQSVLDGAAPQQGGAFTSDSPGTALTSGVMEQINNASFSTYLMYRLNSSSRTEDGVWVPIKRADWQFTGDAFLSAPNVWSLRSGNPAQSIQAQNTSAYPVWTSGLNPENPPSCSTLPTVAAVSVSPSQVASGANASITVTLNQAAPGGGAAITLSANGPFTPQASCNVSAGQTTGTCSGTAGSVTASTQVTVTAVYYTSSQGGTVTVVPLP